MANLDYTNYRKGKRVPECSNRKIDVCPKCGKKGVRTNYPSKTSKIKVTEYFHKGYTNNGFTHITESCVITEAVING